MNWPDWAQPVTTPVLAEPYRTPATEWARAWVAERIADHTTAGRNWAAADAHDAFYPHDLLVPAGEVPEASPFLTGWFLGAAHAVPLADRYGPHLPTGYWRCKALVLSLMPEQQAVLPRRKQYFTRALARQATALADVRGPLLVVETGLVDASHLARERDPSVLLAVSAIEQWLRGARERGLPIN